MAHAPLGVVPGEAPAGCGQVAPEGDVSFSLAAQVPTRVAECRPITPITMSPMLTILTAVAGSLK